MSWFSHGRERGGHFSGFCIVGFYERGWVVAVLGTMEEALGGDGC